MIVLVMAFVVFIFNTTSVNAAINSEYSNTDTVSGDTLEESFEESILLEGLAKLVYALGQFFEWILGTIFKLLTGSSDFPWADKIVFNAVPLLDVNFINPDVKSFVGQPQIKSILKNLYATILAMAVTFFGITVMITAIKLVISTIASEKAKYKQAIVDWVTGLVMLFCMHFFISFIFYLNEQLVIVASKVVTSQLATQQVLADVRSSEFATDLADSMEDHTWNGINSKELLLNNRQVVSKYINLQSEDSSKGLHEFLMKKQNTLGWDRRISDKAQKDALTMIINWATRANISVAQLQEIRNSIKIVSFFSIFEDQKLADYRIEYFQEGRSYLQVISKSDIDKIFPGKGENKMVYEKIKAAGVDQIIKIGNEVYYGTSGANQINKKATPSASNTDFYWSDLLDDLIQLKSSSDTSTGKHLTGSGRSQRLISDLASYFKQNAAEKAFRSTNKTGLKNTGNINIQNMIMYAILVVQSLILFIAYIKRLFYVVMLAMMAPIVVVFDFFQRFGK